MWSSVNNIGLGGFPGEEKTNYKNLKDFLAKNIQGTGKVGEKTVNGQTIYEVSIGGIGESYGVMLEKPDGSVFEFNFINIWDKSKVSKEIELIVNSIKVY
jgi:hypothetical protein